jgi:hypothetical protein
VIRPVVPGSWLLLCWLRKLSPPHANSGYLSEVGVNELGVNDLGVKLAATAGFWEVRARHIGEWVGGREEWRVNRDEAAYLLGVPANADPDVIRHAWRLWARIAHPDVDGDPDHFAQLDAARRILLQPFPTSAVVIAARPRESWSQVVRRPAHPFALVLVGIVAILIAAFAGVSSLPFLVTVAACSCAAAVWAVWAMLEILSTSADHGHRIAALALLWLPIACMQVLVSTFVAASFVSVLPILALPLVAVVALANPGAGLWRPVGR